MQCRCSLPSPFRQPPNHPTLSPYPHPAARAPPPNHALCTRILPSITTRHRPIAVRSVAGATRANPHNDSAESLSWPLQLAYRSNQSSYRRSDHRRSIARVPPTTPIRPSNQCAGVPHLDHSDQPAAGAQLSCTAHDGPVLIQSSSSTLPTRCRSHRYHPRARLGGDSTGRALPLASTMRTPTPS